MPDRARVGYSIMICPDCRADAEVICPRNVDGKCLECGAELCAAHLMEHFRTKHCMALTLDHAKAGT